MAIAATSGQVPSRGLGGPLKGGVSRDQVELTEENSAFEVAFEHDSSSPQGKALLMSPMRLQSSGGLPQPVETATLCR